MADNYIEKKMEELRSGRLAVRNRCPGIKPGAKRVIIAGGCSGKAYEMALTYRRDGCRVAVFDDDVEVGKRMAYSDGVRFHRVSSTDREAVRNEIRSLLDIWRGIDIIAGEEEICATMWQIIKEWQETLPIPDNSDVEIVILRKNSL